MLNSTGLKALSGSIVHVVKYVENMIKEARSSGEFDAVYHVTLFSKKHNVSEIVLL